jgi:hypothetical protein
MRCVVARETKLTGRWEEGRRANPRLVSGKVQCVRPPVRGAAGDDAKAKRPGEVSPERSTAR